MSKMIDLERSNTTKAAAGLLHDLGIEYEGPRDEMMQHAETMCEALLLIAEKRVGYGSTWKRHGYMGTLLKAHIKTERLMNLLWHSSGSDKTVAERVGEAAQAERTEPVADTWIDLLVYACFGLQQWRWRDAYGSRD